MVKNTICLVVLLIMAGGSPSWAQGQADDIDRQLQPGYDFLASGRPGEAIKVFRDVNKTQKNACGKCLAATALAYFRAGQLRDAIQESDRALAVSTEDSVRLRSREIKGASFRSLGDPANLQRSEDEYRTGIREFPEAPGLHMGLGITLLKQKRDADGVAELNSFIEKSTDSAAVAQARKFIADPRRARENFAPPFTLTTLQGQEISLEKLAGKIVVLDFWATWCPACRAGLPELKELVAKYPEERLCLVSVSVDEDAAKWRDFVGDHKMVCPQYRDADHKITTSFAVQVFPTYIVIDGDGLIQQRIVGTNPQQSVAYRLRQVLGKLPRLQ